MNDFEKRLSKAVNEDFFKYEEDYKYSPPSSNARRRLRLHHETLLELESSYYRAKNYLEGGDKDKALKMFAGFCMALIEWYENQDVWNYPEYYKDFKPSHDYS